MEARPRLRDGRRRGRGTPAAATHSGSPPFPRPPPRDGGRAAPAIRPLSCATTLTPRRRRERALPHHRHPCRCPVFPVATGGPARLCWRLALGLADWPWRGRTAQALALAPGRGVDLFEVAPRRREVGPEHSPSQRGAARLALSTLLREGALIVGVVPGGDWAATGHRHTGDGGPAGEVLERAHPPFGGGPLSSWAAAGVATLGRDSYGPCVRHDAASRASQTRRACGDAPRRESVARGRQKTGCHGTAAAEVERGLWCQVEAKWWVAGGHCTMRRAIRETCFARRAVHAVKKPVARRWHGGRGGHDRVYGQPVKMGISGEGDRQQRDKPLFSHNAPLTSGSAVPRVLR